MADTTSPLVPTQPRPDRAKKAQKQERSDMGTFQKKEAPEKFAKSDLLQLDNQKTLDLVIKSVLEGLPVEMACSRHLVDPEDMYERRHRVLLRLKSASEWDKHVHNSLTQAETAFTEIFIKKWTNAKSKLELDAARSYLQVVKPQFSGAHNRRAEFDGNILLDIVKQYATRDVYLQILTHLKEIDAVKAVRAFDDFILGGEDMMRLPLPGDDRDMESEEDRIINGELEEDDGGL